MARLVKGDRVIVISECASQGQTGTVQDVNRWTEYVDVKLDDDRSVRTYMERSLRKIDNNKEEVNMDGNFQVAVVALLGAYDKKDYGFALYDDSAKVGDMVVANPLGQFQLGKIKNILPKDQWPGPNITKEVVAIVDMSSYDKRVADREHAVEVAKKKKELQGKLDAKIAKLKDIDFYERAAADFGTRDPEIREMVDLLKSLI